MSDLVTGDAVVLDVRLARFPARLLALLVDVALVLLLLALVGAAADRLTDGADTALGATVALVVVVSLLVGLPTAVETVTRGRSLGKLVMGLRVVRDDGGPVRFRQALTRALFAVVEIWITTGVVALLASLLSERGKRLGDVFAGTVVVRERMPVQSGQVAQVPPSLVPWASTADVDRVPDSLLFSARQLVARLGHLSVEVRHRLAVEMATEVARHVSPPSPPGTPPDAYLMAVVAERRRREQWRAQSQHQPQPGTPAPPLPPVHPSPTAPTAPVAQEHAPHQQASHEQPPPPGGGFAPPA